MTDPTPILLPPRYERIDDPARSWGRFFGLMRALVIRDLKSRYRRSMLGPLWAILQPLAYMVVFTLIREILQINTGKINYVIFTYCALVPWTFFTNAVTRACASVTANAGVVKKIAIAREVFPFSAVVASLVDFAIASVILAGMMIAYQIPIGGAMVWLPVLMAMLILLAAGLGLGAASLGTYKNDILFGIPLVMQIWMLSTPIMYPLTQVPAWIKPYYCLNPMVGLIEGFRAVLVNNATPDTALLATTSIGIAAVWAVAWPLFRYMSRYFAEVL